MDTIDRNDEQRKPDLTVLMTVGYIDVQRPGQKKLFVIYHVGTNWNFLNEAIPMSTHKIVLVQKW